MKDPCDEIRELNEEAGKVFDGIRTHQDLFDTDEHEATNYVLVHEIAHLRLCVKELLEYVKKVERRANEGPTF